MTFGLEQDLIYDVPLIQRMEVIGLKDLSCKGEELIEIAAQKQDAIIDSHWSSALEADAQE